MYVCGMRLGETQGEREREGEGMAGMRDQSGNYV